MVVDRRFGAIPSETLFVTTDNFVKHEFGGLEADISAYDGLISISGGATAEIPTSTFLAAAGGTLTGAVDLNVSSATALQVRSGSGSAATFKTDGTNTILTLDNNSDNWGNPLFVLQAGATADQARYIGCKQYDGTLCGFVGWSANDEFLVYSHGDAGHIIYHRTETNGGTGGGHLWLNPTENAAGGAVYIAYENAGDIGSGGIEVYNGGITAGARRKYGEIKSNAIRLYDTQLSTSNAKVVELSNSGDIGTINLYSGGTLHEFITCTSTAVYTNCPANMQLYSNNAQAAGMGPGIIFGGKYTDAGGYTQWAYIGGVKEAADSGYQNGKLIFGVRALGQGATDLARMTLTSTAFAVNVTTMGFFGKTPTSQPAHVADPTDLATALTAIASIIDALKAVGLMAADP